MNYHIVSTGRCTGAIFTNMNEAKTYLETHPGSTLSTTDRLPDRIPAKKVISKSCITMVPNESPRLLSGPLKIYTDGSCVGNPGPGGYGIVIIDQDGDAQELSQGYGMTTNQRMELLAVITALELIPGETAAIIHSDSKYVIDSINKGWARRWETKGWKTSSGVAANVDLWTILLRLLDKLPHVSFQWVKGHNGDPLNEKADTMANAAARSDDLMVDSGYDPGGPFGPA